MQERRNAAARHSSSTTENGNTRRQEEDIKLFDVALSNIMARSEICRTTIDGKRQSSDENLRFTKDNEASSCDSPTEIEYQKGGNGK